MNLYNSVYVKNREILTFLLANNGTNNSLPDIPAYLLNLQQASHSKHTYFIMDFLQIGSDYMVIVV